MSSAGSRSGPTAQRVRVALTVAWPIALGAWIYAVAGRLGFSPLDEGFIASQSRRILHGDVPHLDLVSPKPLGSALLHLVDLGVPLPLFVTVRVMGIAEVTLYSLLFAALIYRRPPWRWSRVQTVGGAAAILINIGAFPLMSWPTIDGLLLVAVGFTLLDVGLRHDRRRLVLGAFLALGLALLVKQSFALAPVIGLVYVWWTARRDGAAWLPRVALSAGVCAIPVVAYVVAIAAFGGFDEMVTQITNAPGIWGRPIIYAFHLRPDMLELLGIMAAAGALTVGIWAADRRQPGAAPLALVLRAAFALLVVVVALHEDLIAGGRWGLQLMWVLGGVLVLRALLERRIDYPGFVLLGVAYMATLALGLGAPNLVTGTVALFLVHRTFEGVQPAWPQLRLAGSVAVAAVAIATALVFVKGREQFPYFDRAESELTATLDDVSSEFGRTRTNPVSATYVKQLSDCLDDHPARWVAMLPDNPSLYVVLDKDNPFPLDWMFPPEYKGSRDRILSAARELGRRGDYLVLFQTVDGFKLYKEERLTRATPSTTPYWHEPDPTLGEEIRAALPGRRIACGSFVGVHDPASTAAN